MNRTGSRVAVWCYSLLVLSMLTACSGSFGVDEQALKAADTHTRLGLGRLEQGLLDAAVTELKKALDASSDYPEAHSSIAIVYDRMGKYELAEEHYLEAIDLKPEDGNVYNNYGVFLCQRRRLNEADEYFLKALNTPRYRTPERAWENAGACARQIPDIEKAETYLRKALTINAKLPVALFEMAAITFDQKRYMSTRAYLQRFSEVAQHSPQSLWLGLRAERELGDKEAAAGYAKLLQQKFPDSLQFKWLLDSEPSGTLTKDLRLEILSTGSTSAKTTSTDTTSTGDTSK